MHNPTLIPGPLACRTCVVGMQLGALPLQSPDRVSRALNTKCSAAWTSRDLDSGRADPSSSCFLSPSQARRISTEGKAAQRENPSLSFNESSDESIYIYITEDRCIRAMPGTTRFVKEEELLNCQQQLDAAKKANEKLREDLESAVKARNSAEAEFNRKIDKVVKNTKIPRRR
jgi:hypothetical protein